LLGIQFVPCCGRHVGIIGNKPRFEYRDQWETRRNMSS
jgi:hypothetical protein